MRWILLIFAHCWIKNAAEIILHSASMYYHVDGGPLTFTKYGVSNRLEVLSFARLIAMEHFHSGFYFEWPLNAECDGHFLEAFKPVVGIHFVQPEEKSAFFNETRQIVSVAWDFYKNMANYPEVVKIRNTSLDALKLTIHQYLEPTNEIQQIVRSFIKQYNICNAIALHIRRTDLKKEVESYKGHSNAYFEELIKQSKVRNVFLMTDCQQTLKYFRSRYPKKIIVYPSSLYNYEDNQLWDGTQLFRQTRIRSTVIEMYIAVHAKYFYGSHFSTLSRFIEELRAERSQNLSSTNIC